MTKPISPEFKNAGIASETPQLTLPFQKFPLQERPGNPKSRRPSIVNAPQIDMVRNDELNLFTHSGAIEAIALRLTAEILKSLPTTRYIDENGIEAAAFQIKGVVKTLLIRLCLLDSKVTHFSDYVPLDKYRYLDRDFISWVSRIRPLRRLSFQLYDLGKERLGQVIQMTESEVLDRTSADREVVQILKDDLATVGLRLGMKAPRWRGGTPKRTQVHI